MSSQWFSVGGRFRGVVGLRTLRRRPQSMRRISMVSADRELHTWRGSKSQSVASWSWYSSSQVDLMLISRKRANSFGVAEPQPSTMLNTIDSAALSIWDLSDPRSVRGKPRTARRTFNTCACALCHTNSRRKSCIPTFWLVTGQTRRPFPGAPHQFFCARPLTTTDYSRTNQLSTQNLDPLSRTSNSPRANLELSMLDLARTQ